MVANRAQVTVNGKAVSGARAGAYLPIRRRWSPGDTVRLQLDMTPQALCRKSARHGRYRPRGGAARSADLLHGTARSSRRRDARRCGARSRAAQSGRISQRVQERFARRGGGAASSRRGLRKRQSPTARLYPPYSAEARKSRAGAADADSVLRMGESRPELHGSVDAGAG